MTGHAPPLLEARGLTRMFGDLAALSGVDLAIAPGERHALLGENGAGKSTLVKLLFGMLAPSAGEILWQGRPFRPASPAEARARGIAMVFQHFAVFEALTVAENIALGLPGESVRSLRARILRAAEVYGLTIDPDRAVHTLSAGEKQRVEILRCLLQSPRLLILDEPTSVLTPQEAETLFAALGRLSEEGCAVLLISHRLEEVRSLCTRATVLRGGRVVGDCDPRETSAASLAEMMVGERVAGLARGGSGRPDGRGVPTPRRGEGQQPVRLRLRGLALPGTPPHGVDIGPLDLSVRRGEIVGIAGVAGEGQQELMAALIGERRAPRAEMVEIDGHPAGRLGPNVRRRAGAAFVPEDRIGHAAVATMTLAENVLLAHHRAEGLAPRGWIARVRLRDWAERIRETFDVRARGASSAASTLSGGNLQKFVVGREILRKPGVLAVNQPTWGVDAGAARTIRQALIDLAAGGAAVLVISQDLDELFAIADRIAVIHRGRLSTPEPASSLDAARIGMLMGGAEPGAASEDAA